MEASEQALFLLGDRDEVLSLIDVAQRFCRHDGSGGSILWAMMRRRGGLLYGISPRGTRSTACNPKRREIDS